MLKNAFYVKSVQRVQLAFKTNILLQVVLETSIVLRNKIQFALKNNILLHFVLEFSFCLILRPSCQQMRFRQIYAKNSSLSSTMRIARFCLGMWLLQNFEHLLQKTAFCVKTSQRIEPPLKNCILLHYVFKAGFSQILGIFFKKKAFCVKSTQIIQTAFSKNLGISCQNMFFCVKSAQRIELAPKKCLLLYFVLKTSFCQILSIFCQNLSFASTLREK